MRVRILPKFVEPMTGPIRAGSDILTTENGNQPLITEDGTKTLTPEGSSA